MTDLPRKQLSEPEKGMIIAWKQQKQSNRSIANWLQRSPQTICDFVNKYGETKSTKRAVGSGRKRSTSARMDRLITKHRRLSPHISTRQLKENLKLDISEKTITRRCKEVGLYCYRYANKPFVSRCNQRKRYEWAKKHASWSKKKWRQVIFSDESPFTLNYQGRRRIWRRRNDIYNSSIIGTVKHPTYINVWGCFCYHGVGMLHQIHGKMDSEVYVNILEESFLPSKAKLYQKKNMKTIFQFDNDPKHTSLMSLDFLVSHEIDMLDWPSSSPDINPIENLWGILEQQTMDRNPTSKDELFSLLYDVWNKTDMSIIHNLIDSMPKRCELLIASKGKPIKY